MRVSCQEICMEPGDDGRNLVERGGKVKPGSKQ